MRTRGHHRGDVLRLLKLQIWLLKCLPHRTDRDILDLDLLRLRGRVRDTDHGRRASNDRRLPRDHRDSPKHADGVILALRARGHHRPERRRRGPESGAWRRVALLRCAVDCSRAAATLISGGRGGGAVDVRRH